MELLIGYCFEFQSSFSNGILRLKYCCVALLLLCIMFYFKASSYSFSHMHDPSSAAFRLLSNCSMIKFFHLRKNCLLFVPKNIISMQKRTLITSRYIFGFGCKPLLYCSWFSPRIHRHALWILGEYCTKASDILAVMKEIKDGLGEVHAILLPCRAVSIISDIQIMMPI